MMTMIVKKKGIKMTESKNNYYRLKEFFDEDSWRRSAKGQQERAWWFNHCHAETENRWRNKKGTQNFFACDDADESIMRFGKFFVDDETDKPVEPNYVASLLKSWGDPSDLNKKKKVRESEDTVDIYQVVRDSDIKSSLGDDVSNIEPQVVSEFDCKDCAEDKANELNSTVTPGEKAVLGTEYSVQKKDIELKEAESVGPYYAVVNYGNIGSPIYAHGPYDTKEEAQSRAKFIRRTFGPYERYCRAWCRVMTQKDIDRADRMGYGYKIENPKK